MRANFTVCPRCKQNTTISASWHWSRTMQALSRHHWIFGYLPLLVLDPIQDSLL